ncbi:hypothetical protein NL676_036958 [Syzygium grande]|nr:hypothetical protein NL676_036958 [Syzygium grande]
MEKDDRSNPPPAFKKRFGPSDHLNETSYHRSTPVVGARDHPPLLEFSSRTVKADLTDVPISSVCLYGSCRSITPRVPLVLDAGGLCRFERWLSPCIAVSRAKSER